MNKSISVLLVFLAISASAQNASPVSGAKLSNCPIGPWTGKLTLFEIKGIERYSNSPLSDEQLIKVSGKGKINDADLTHPATIIFRSFPPGSTCSSCTPPEARRIPFSQACANFSEMATNLGRAVVFQETTADGSNFKVEQVQAVTNVVLESGTKTGTTSGGGTGPALNSFYALPQEPCVFSIMLNSLPDVVAPTYCGFK